jgi:tryptophan halogenase
MSLTTWRDYAAAARLDRIAHARTDPAASPSLTRIAAQAHGWTVEIPLQDCVCRTIVFAQNTPPAGVTEAFPVSRGRRAPWAGNVVAVGESAAQLDPLLDPRLDILTAGLRHLIELLPAGASSFEAAEYNRIMENVFDRCNDFQALQYWIADTRGGHKWAACAESTQTPELARKRRQFESRGRMIQYDEETFDETMWIASFLGGGALPRRYDPLADNWSQADAAATLKAMRKAVSGAAEAMPDQMDYLRRANAITAEREAQ